MAKKKHKKKNKKNTLLNEMDKSINSNYNSLMEEIEDLQIQLNIADQKARKKARKKLRKNPEYFKVSDERIKARKKVISKMEGSNLLERLHNFFQSVGPLIVIIARLVACLITTILNIDIIKVNIKPETLKKLNSVYQTAMSVK